MPALHFATFERVLKETKKGIRVSDEATKELIENVEGIARRIAADSLELALHANRRTIMKEDVKLASKKWLPRY